MTNHWIHKTMSFPQWFQWALIDFYFSKITISWHTHAEHPTTKGNTCDTLLHHNNMSTIKIKILRTWIFLTQKKKKTPHWCFRFSHQVPIFSPSPTEPAGTFRFFAHIYTHISQRKDKNNQDYQKNKTLKNKTQNIK